MSLPRSWDDSLERLIGTSSVHAEVEWGAKVKEYLGDTATFIEAINRRIPVGDITRTKPRVVNDPTRVREERLIRLMEARVPARKPVVLPCPRAAVIQRDKQRLEMVIRERRERAGIPMRPVVANSMVTQGLVRRPTVAHRSVSCQKPRAFYWGA